MAALALLRTLAAACLAAAGTMAQADPLEAHIDKSDQEMSVYLDDALIHRWPVSTARAGKVTPSGRYRPQVLKRMHYSTLYNNAPMPFSIFFHGNYAIHGTDQTEKLGCPASAGCVRLHPENAETLFNLVREIGPENTLIVIRD
ncbi:L,D-transpeptidase [Lutimaribacter marinistellae]|uniref:L,D-transpeptidase n=1 Tax=Lutimaribacter marinistellae TaxID=1820329 RepID=A0ABV7TAZ7_9RHOB